MSTSIEPSGDHLSDKHQMWDKVRSGVIHEDNLVNFRITWILTIESVLLGGISVLESALLGSSVSEAQLIYIHGFVAILLLMASLCAIAAGYSVWLANRHLDDLRSWWINTYPEESPTSLPPQIPQTPFPPVMGYFPSICWFFKTANIPWMLLTLNVLALVWAVVGQWLLL